MKLATFECDGYQLSNGEKLHKKNPKKFWIPSLKIRNNFKVGDVVKLVFEYKKPLYYSDFFCYASAERMWVIIKEVKDGNYIGVLANSPNPESNLTIGDEIFFKPKHIITYE